LQTLVDEEAMPGRQRVFGHLYWNLLDVCLAMLTEFCYSRRTTMIFFSTDEASLEYKWMKSKGMKSKLNVGCMLAGRIHYEILYRKSESAPLQSWP
jgi:hypothetical protein